MLAKSCNQDRALKACVHKKPDTDSAPHCKSLHCAAATVQRKIYIRLVDICGY